MPRASHERMHNALFGQSQPLPPRLRRICACQLVVAAALAVQPAAALAQWLPMLGEEPMTLLGALVAYVASVLVSARDQGLYIRLMVLWSILSAGAIAVLLRALGRPAARERIGGMGLLAPAALHLVALALNVAGVAAILSRGKVRRRTKGERSV